ncbi:hypothetical protein HDU97_009511 [Phlyctochytrium planicorne]|nr:hypothetical protein HDU97_009511 [Phlyctochytrium planicorne]
MPSPSSSSDVNIIVIAPQFLDDFEGGYSDINLYAGGLSYITAAEVAVADMPAAKTIPGAKINLHILDNWNPDFKSSTNYSLIDSGGYAAAKLYDMITSNDVVALVGDMYSRTTVFTAGIASQFKIPFCGSVQASPKLSDLRNFSYFFRLQLAKGISRPVGRLLLHYQILKVMDETRQTFNSHNITILADLKVTQDMITKNDYSALFSRMKLAKGHVYVTSLLSENLTPFYFKAADYGFVNQDSVWIGYNWPYLDSTLSDEERKKQKELATGFIAAGPTQEHSDFVVKRFNRAYWRITNQTHPEWFEDAAGIPYQDSGGVFDCMKIMLYGLFQFLDTNPELTARDLSNPAIRQNLTISKFSNLGYSGAATVEAAFSDEGDLQG